MQNKLSDLITDPVEKLVAQALEAKGEIYYLEQHPKNLLKLDFFLPNVGGEGIYIECKRFHTDRVNEQLSRAENIILVQGINSARVFKMWMQGH